MAPAGLIGQPSWAARWSFQVKLAPVWVSVRYWPASLMALPAALDLLPGLATDTAPVIDQVKLAEPELPRLSVAVRVTLEVPEVWRAGDGPRWRYLSVSPVGSPVADQLRWCEDESVALLASVVMALPAGARLGAGCHGHGPDDSPAKAASRHKPGVGCRQGDVGGPGHRRRAGIAFPAGLMSARGQAGGDQVRVAPKTSRWPIGHVVIAGSSGALGSGLATDTAR